MTDILSVLRRRAFWGVDSLKGKPVKRHYEEIRNILENPLDVEAVQKRDGHLSKVLIHATTTVPFYKRCSDFKKLQDFPIINKNLILDNFEGFKSSRFDKMELFPISTSGSTGIPFKIFQDKNKKNRNVADVIYFSGQAGHVLGDKLYFLKLWDHKNQKGRLVSWLQNIYAHNVMDTSKKDLTKLVSDIGKDKLPKNVLGYPSFFEILCDFMDSMEVVPKIQGTNSIISFAENLKDKERERMSKYFKTSVYARYSNQENGILAQETVKEPTRLMPNWASYYFEVLALDSNEHVRSGELGRLVLTDLFNYAMPMIRYDTGDLVVYEESKFGPYFSSIFGRRMDTVFDTTGKMINPHVFYMVLDYGSIRQFQFVQTGKKDYAFRLNAIKGQVQENQIVDYFKPYLGNDATILFEYVDGIPLLASGKRKKIVNEYFEFK
jgi:Coenzyme F390 synthetase